MLPHRLLSASVLFVSAFARPQAVTESSANSTASAAATSTLNGTVTSSTPVPSLPVAAAPRATIDLLSQAALPNPFESRSFSAPYQPITNPTNSNGGTVNLTATPHFQIYHAQAASKLLTDNATIIRIVQEPGYAFAHEAPAYFSDTDSLYFCSDAGGALGRSNVTTNNALFEIKNVSSVADRAASNVAGGQTTFEADVTPLSVNSSAIQMTNGGAPYGPAHYLTINSGRTDTLAGGLALISRSNVSEIQVLVNNAFGKQFNSPNDVAVHPISGQIFFTDAWYGATQGFRPRNLTMPLMTWVFDPATGELKALDDTVQTPNGIAISPDGKTLVVTDTSAAGFSGSDPASTTTIVAWDIATDDAAAPQTKTHSLRNRRIFAWPTSGIADGIKFDEDGNVWAGTADGVEVWNPNGSRIMKVFLPDGGAVNLAFAGKGQLAVLAQEKVWLVRGLAVNGPDLSALPTLALKQ